MNTKKSLLISLVLVVGLLFAMLPGGKAEAATLCVAPGGAGGCYATIQNAIDAAAPGDTVMVAAGVYSESMGGWRDIELFKSLSLIGAGSGSTIVELTGLQHGMEINPDVLGTVLIQGISFTKPLLATRSAGWAILVGETGGTFNSLIFRDVEVAWAEARNLHLAAATYNNVVLDGCNIHDSGAWGFSIRGVIGALVVLDSHFDFNGRSDPAHGIGFDLDMPTSVGTLTITGGTFNNNSSTGITLVNTTDATFTNIIASNNAVGVNIWEWLGTSSNLTFINPSLMNNSLDGFLIGSETGKTVSGVTILGGTLTGNGRTSLFIYREAGWGDGIVSDITIQNAVLDNTNLALPYETINAAPNYWGTTNAAAIAAAAGGGVKFNPWCLDAACTQLYVANGGKIQDAIDAADPGDTIIVEAGTYEEYLLIEKPLLLLGPNALINPNTETRVAEALIQYPLGIASDKDLIDIFADNVTVAGFTVDGQGLPGTYWGEGIYSEGNNITIKNNIVKNFDDLGIRAGANYGGPYFTGILIENNKITSDVAGFYFSYSGVYLQGSQGTVKGNVIDSAYRGVQIQPYTNPAATQGVVEANIITAYRSPLYFNYSEHTNANWLFKNNVVSGYDNPLDPVTRWDGLIIQTFLAGNVAFTGNTVNFGNITAGEIYPFGIINWPTTSTGTVDLDSTFANNTFERVVVITDGTNIIKKQPDMAFYSLIQPAIDAATGGETILVGPGTYVEYVSINKDLILIGDPGAIIQKPTGEVYYKLPDESGRSFRPIVLAYGGTITGGDGLAAGTAYTIQGIDTVNVLIKGFRIDGGAAWSSTSNSNFADGILLRNVIGEVSSNTIDSLVTATPTSQQYTIGIEMRGDNSDIDIIDNTVTEFGRTGIYMAGKVGTPVVLIDGNEVTSAYYGPYLTNGIEIAYGATGTIKDNDVNGATGEGTVWTGTCIMLFGANNATVSGNRVSICDVGISVGGRTTYGVTALNNTVIGNTIDQCTWSSIEINTNAQNTKIQNNIITNVAARGGTEEAGIVVLEYSDPAAGYPNGVLIEGNTISGAPGFWGIDIYRNADNVTIQKNMITGGAVGVALELKGTNSIGKTVTISNTPGLGNRFIGQTGLAVSTGPYTYSSVVYQWIPDVPATYNYWGSACGPTLISDNVLYSPWYTNEAMTALGSGVTGSYVFPTVGSTTDSMNAIIECAAPGSTLTFEGGTYPGGLFVGPAKYDLTFELNGAMVTKGSSAFQIEGNDITIKGPGVVDGIGGTTPAPGIAVFGDNFILDGVELRNWFGGAVVVPQPVESLKIVNNWFHHNGAGLQVQAVPTGVVTIKGNLFKENGEGVQYVGPDMLDATYNSWGSVGGPLGTNGDGVGANVVYDPWTFSEIYMDLIPDTGALVRHVALVETFEVKIKAEAANLYGLSFKFTYDEDVIVLNMTNFDTYWAGSCTPRVNPMPAGEVEYFCSKLTGPEWQGGTIATFTFTPIATAAESFFDIYTDITLSSGAVGGVKVFVNNAGYNDPSVPTRDITDTDDGKLIIDAVAQFTGFIDLQGRPDDSGALLQVYDLISGGVLKASALSASSGKYTTTYAPGMWMVVSLVPPEYHVPYYLYVDRDLFLPTYTPRLVKELTVSPLTSLQLLLLLGGDGMNDNVININDASCIGWAYGGSTNMCAGSGSNSDVTGDGVINIYDLTLMGSNFTKTFSPWAP